MKYCPKCQTEKSLQDYTRDKSTKDGFSCYCKDCRKYYTQKYYQDNKINILERNKTWRKENQDVVSKLSLEWYHRKENKEKVLGKAKSRQVNNKQKAVEYMGGSCSICNYNRCLDALHFHHKNPKEKETKVSALLKLSENSWERIKEELDKCILVCANCHAEIHSQPIENKKVI